MGIQKDFKKYFYDKYFNIQSDKQKTFEWVILYMSKLLPNKIPKNIFLIHLKRSEKFNLLFLFKNLFLILKYSNNNLLTFLKNPTSQFLLSSSAERIFANYIEFAHIKNVIIPYEGQLFQKKLIRLIRKNNKKVKIVGYDHTAPQTLPINLFYDNNSPDELLITSKNKFLFHKKYLNWPKNKLKINNSFRFKINPKDFQGKIFLPYVIEDLNLYERRLNRLLEYIK